MTLSRFTPFNSERHWDQDFPGRAAKSLDHVDSLDGETLRAFELNELLANIVDANCAGPIIADFDRKVARDHSYRNTVTDIPTIAITIDVPCSGAIAVLNKYTSADDRAMTDISGSDLPNNPAGRISMSLHLSETSPELESLDEIIVQWLEVTSERIQRSNQEIQEHRRVVTAHVRDRIALRQRAAGAFRSATERLLIPLIGEDRAASPLPLKANPTLLKASSHTRNNSTDDWRLEREIADDVVETVVAFSQALERTPRTAAQLLEQNEESIRDVLLFSLNAGYRGLVVSEAFSGAGKTDILLRWHDRNAFIAECKIWSGQGGLVDGIDQLLGRYVTWRDACVALVVFMKNERNPSTLLSRARLALSSHADCTATLDSPEPNRRQDYFFRSRNDSDRVVRVSLIPVVISLHQETGGES